MFLAKAYIFHLVNYIFMRILKIILLVLAVFVGLLLVAALFAPKSFAVERSTVIKAPRAVVYDQVRHFKNFAAWSPWQHLDPDMTTNIEGTDGAVGAKYTWKGNADAGSGSQEIVSLKEGEEVNIKLHFLEPFDSQSDSYFKLADADGDTRLTWGMKGNMAIPFNVVGLLMDIESGVGKDYENGLNNLKAICEQAANNSSKTLMVKEIDFAGANYATIRRTVAFKDIASFYTTNYALINKEMARNKTTVAGNPMGFFYNYDEKSQKTDMAAALPVSAEAAFTNGVSAVKLPAGKNLCVDYYGDYTKSAPAYDAIEQYVRAKQLRTGSPITEEYVTDPRMEKDTAKWLTRICFPVAE